MIGTTGAARSALFPDFPTIAEIGLADYQSLGWFGLFAPAGTSREIVAKVSADVGRVLASPEARQRLAEQGAEGELSTPDAFTAFVNADVAKWLDPRAQGRDQTQSLAFAHDLFRKPATAPHQVPGRPFFGIMR